MRNILYAMTIVAAIGFIASVYGVTIYSKIKSIKVLKTIAYDDILVALILMMSGALIGWIFYMSYIASMLVAVIGLFFIKYYWIWREKRRREGRTEEFLEINRLLVSELYAGKSVERAYRDIKHRLKREGSHHFPYMQAELEMWCLKFDAGLRFKDVILEFAETSQDDAIKQFAAMFESALANGANLLEIIEMVNRIIRDKRQIQREIDVLIAEKKLEQKLLSIAPIVLLLFMQKTSYSFISPLYETVVGRLLMTVALIVFVVCYLWSLKMTEVNL